MKNLLLVVMLGLSALTAMAQDVTARIKQEAEKCAKALLAGDYEGVATYTHKRVITLMGGKEVLVASLKRGIEQMRADGYDFADASVGSPSEPKKIGAWITSMVPQEVVMKVPGGRLHQESFLLAISEDEGMQWVFLDLGPITPAQFTQVFPELDGKISLPAKKSPVLRKNEKG